MKDNKEREVDEEIYVGTTTKVIYTPADISSLIDDLVTTFNKTRESSYTKLFALFSIDIHIATAGGIRQAAALPEARYPKRRGPIGEDTHISLPSLHPGIADNTIRYCR